SSAYSGTGHDQPSVTLFRRWTTAPASSTMAPGPGQRVQLTVAGHPAPALLGPGGYSVVAWRVSPHVVVGVDGYRIDRSTLVRVADGVVYQPGSLGPAVEPTSCGVLPPGAVPRSKVLARYAHLHGVTKVSAKLVRVTTLQGVDPGLVQCTIRACVPGLVVWLVLAQGPPGTFQFASGGPAPLPGQPPPTTHPGSAWRLLVASAATGRASGSEMDSGPVPSFWAGLPDLAPNGPASLHPSH
ncbi:MAG: hypothetical protein ACRD0J_09540, partial [Acidimicrobiales bacterium]